MKEIWKKVNSNYEISSRGRVRSLPRVIEYIKNSKPVKAVFLKTRLLTPHKTVHGYLSIRLGKYSIFTSLHRLVATAFIPNPENRLEVNHKNGIKTDNRVENLEWVTRIENQRHAIDNKLIVYGKGEKSTANKLSQSEVNKIRKLILLGFTQKSIGEKFNTHQSNISYIKNRKTW